MDKIELIQKLHEKAGISLDEAREALDRANWDVLEALLILEREGRIAPITASARTSAAYSSDEDYEENEGTKEKIEKTMRAAADWLRDLFMRIFTHDFAVRGKNGDILRLPAVFLLIATVFAFDAVLIAIIIGLFFNCAYSLEERKSNDVNNNDTSS